MKFHIQCLARELGLPMCSALLLCIDEFIKRHGLNVQPCSQDPALQGHIPAVLLEWLGADDI